MDTARRRQKLISFISLKPSTLSSGSVARVAVNSHRQRVTASQNHVRLKLTTWAARCAARVAANSRRRRATASHGPHRPSPDSFKTTSRRLKRHSRISCMAWTLLLSQVSSSVADLLHACVLVRARAEILCTGAILFLSHVSFL